uniref:protein-tyrosine-phosphatase n=1 Tax=Amphimedon queenslandica TaxID=400682 RepID=A0A1X7TQU1_AMPQE
MVTNLKEGTKSKCEQYWPNGRAESEEFGPFSVTLVDEQVLPDFVIRSITVMIQDGSNDSHTLTQYHLTSWPDHGVPEYGTPLMILHRQSNKSWSPSKGPILVHCSAGVGRTGTFIAIDIALEQAKRERVVDIAGIVNRLRQQRMKMVQTLDQYVFLHDTVLEAIICGETEIPTENYMSTVQKLKETGIKAQFGLLHQVTPDPNDVHCNSAKAHATKNRSNKYLPPDKFIVALKEANGYINASYLNGYREKRAFIIAQSPMENTVRDFWKMILDYKVSAIVMLCGEEDCCFPYWLSGRKYDEYGLEVTNEINSNGYTERMFKVSSDKEAISRNVLQLQVADWPQDGVVREPRTVLQVIDDVIHRQQKIGGGPVVVHCSDTVSRSGVYCSVSIGLEQCKAEGVVDVFQVTKAVRRSKPGAVTTLEQYTSIYDVIDMYLQMNSIEVISECPPSSGIYLKHGGNCYTNGSYFWDNTVNEANEAISCVLPDTSLTTGQWTRAGDPDDPVDCDNTNNDPFRCTLVTSPNATINLYLEGGLSQAQEGWYKCCLPTNCTDPNTNIIFATIFRYSEIESFTVADLPSDMTVYPQEYKLNCTKIGHNRYDISMSIGSTALASYTNCEDGVDHSPCHGTVLVSSSNTLRYTVDITWDGMTVSSGSISQSTTGDQMYQCVLDNISGANRTRTLTIKVPATAPSSLTEVNQIATTITVSWTALDSSDADGYVVNVTSDTDTVQTVQVEGSSNNTVTLNGLRGGTTYSITVRAYQQLLGPASTISVQTLPVINWTLVSSITQLNNTQYRIDCLTTTDINPSTDVYWLVNGVMKSNSMYTSIDVRTYNNTLLVYPDPLGVSVNVTCIAKIGGVNYSQSVVLHAPSGPPNNVRGFILNATSIKVNWTTSSITNGYVIEYATGGVTRNVVSTSEEEIVLTDLSPMSTYTISVYSYIDLPSVNSTVTVLRFD